MTDVLKKEDLLTLANRMIHLRYSIDSHHMDRVFREISIADYMVLYSLSKRMGINQPETKVYLSEMSKELDIPISRVSRMVQNLQNKGYVYWEHDSQGTYIYMSEIGSEVMIKQQQILRQFFGKVIDRLGMDEFIQTLDMMYQVEVIMESEAAKLVVDDGSSESGEYVESDVSDAFIESAESGR
ncbi:MAG: helix-turn-helix domain-containing protein [Clostridiales bacterium]|nr:helix-turn-helix domain-containing protein [Clostridiales bacterium]